MALKWGQQPASRATAYCSASNPQPCCCPKEHYLSIPSPSLWPAHCLRAWEKQVLCDPSTAVTQDVSLGIKICSRRRKELENVILPLTNTHYLWIISLAFILLESKVALTNAAMFLMTCFFGYIGSCILKGKAHTDSGLINWGWHSSPSFTETSAVPPAGQLGWRRQQSVPGYALQLLPVVLPPLGVPSPCRAGATDHAPCCISLPSCLSIDRAYLCGRPEQAIPWRQNQGGNACGSMSRSPRGHRPYRLNCQEDCV